MGLGLVSLAFSSFKFTVGLLLTEKLGPGALHPAQLQLPDFWKAEVLSGSISGVSLSTSVPAWRSLHPAGFCAALQDAWSARNMSTINKISGNLEL